MLCWILFAHIFSGFLSPFFSPMTLSSWKVQVSCLVQCSIFVCLLSLGIIKFDSLVPMFPVNSKLGLETWWVQVKFFLEVLYHRWCWVLRISLYQETYGVWTYLDHLLKRWCQISPLQCLFHCQVECTVRK